MEKPILTKSVKGESQVLTLKTGKGTKLLGLAIFLVLLGDTFVRYMPYITPDPMRPTGPLYENLFTTFLAVVVLYLVAALSINSRRIVVTAQELLLQIDPLPFPGEKQVHRAELRGFRLIKKRKGTATDILMVLKSGKGEPLLQSLRPHESAVEIKQWLEASLGLPPTKDET